MKSKLLISLLSISISLLTACLNNQTTNTASSSIQTSSNIPEAPLLTYRILHKIPHDVQSFTQGFLVHENYLLEGTGLEKQTKIIRIDTASGKMQVLNDQFPVQIFGEGIAMLKGKLYQLTYKNNLVYVYDLKNLKKPIQTFNWPKEGWGITNDSTSLYISDGSSTIYEVEPKQMKSIREIKVKNQNGDLDLINELEWVNGYIFANRWQDNFIYKIDPKTGYVVGKISFEGVIQMYDKNFVADDDKVLNGIAYDQKNDVFFITGKNWPLIFKIQLN